VRLPVLAVVAALALPAALVPVVALAPVAALVPVVGPAAAVESPDEAPASPPPKRPAEEVRPRVDHHLRHVAALTRHFEALLADECPRFETRAEWHAYLDEEVDRIVLLIAHLERAWREATRTGDDEVRRSAKAPRRQRARAQALLDKLQGCAHDNGSRLPPTALWRRIDREVPLRAREIALPADQAAPDPSAPSR
jgi:hypothetical protein